MEQQGNKQVVTEEQHSLVTTKEDLLAAIDRTLRETAPPPGSDMQRSVVAAINAFWDARKQQVQQEITEEQRALVRETASLARRVAGTLREYEREKEFALDAVLAMAPVIVTLVSIYYLVFKTQLALPSWLPYAMGALALGFAASLAVAYFRPSGRWLGGGLLQHSMGALAGGLVIAALVGYSSFRHSEDLLNSTLALTKYKAEEFSLSWMKYLQQTGHFPQVQASIFEGMSVTPTKVSPSALVVEASAANLPGKLTVQLGSRSGSLMLEREGKQLAVTFFVAGNVVEESENSITVRDAVGSAIRLLLDQNRNVTKPTVGSQVVVAYDPKTNVALLIKD